jgi:hypothetical protein
MAESAVSSPPFSKVASKFAKRPFSFLAVNGSYPAKSEIFYLQKAYHFLRPEKTNNVFC